MIADTGEPPSREETIPRGERSTPPDSDPPHHKSWRPSNPLLSFVHAGFGIKETFRSERNFRIHVVLATLAIGGALILHFSALRIVALLLAASLVFAAELLNTAIEATVDLVMPHRHSLARRAKDAAAGAVLTTAAFAVAIGLVLFVPPLMQLLRPLLRAMPLAVRIVLVLGVAVLVAVAAFSLFRRRNRSGHALPASDLSRKAVIGAVLIASTAIGALQAGAIHRPYLPIAAVAFETPRAQAPALTPFVGVP